MMFMPAPPIEVREIPSVFRTSANLFLRTAIDPSNREAWERKGTIEQAQIWQAASDELFQAAKRLEELLRAKMPTRERMAPRITEQRERMSPRSSSEPAKIKRGAR